MPDAHVQRRHQLHVARRPATLTAHARRGGPCHSRGRLVAAPDARLAAAHDSQYSLWQAPCVSMSRSCRQTRYDGDDVDMHQNNVSSIRLDMSTRRCTPGQAAPERMAAAVAALQWAATAAARAEAGLPAAAAAAAAPLHPVATPAPTALRSRQRAAAHWPGHGRRCAPTPARFNKHVQGKCW
jgi:hypothetical protein